MKKPLLFLLCSISYTTFTKSQVKPAFYTTPKEAFYLNHDLNKSLNKSHQRSAVNFGVKAGMNLSNMNFNKGYPAPESPIAASWNSGFVLGLLMEVPLNERFFIQPEYLYSQLKGEDKESERSYSMSYFSLPVLFKYKIGNRLALLAGPQFDLLIKAKQDGGAGDSNITHDTEERSISATAGIEYNILEKLSLSAGYMHGVNHIGIGQRSAVKEFKYESVKITVAIKF